MVLFFLGFFDSISVSFDSFNLALDFSRCLHIHVISNQSGSRARENSRRISDLESQAKEAKIDPFLFGRRWKRGLWKWSLPMGLGVSRARWRHFRATCIWIVCHWGINMRNSHDPPLGVFESICWATAFLAQPRTSAIVRIIYWDPHLC